jgi:DNA-binding GntR family transcriptional regulator
MVDRDSDREHAESSVPLDEPLSVVDQVAEAILGLILSNDLAQGEPVAIQDLSKRLGVSHVPVREALRRLEGRGLVQFRRGKRPQISPITFGEFEDIYHLRALIEGDVSARSADLMTPMVVAELTSTLDEFERILIKSNAFDVYSAHSRFHSLLLPGATDWDRRVLEELWTASERYIQLYVGARPDQYAVDTIVAAHRRLLSAARSGDNKTISEAVIHHVHESRVSMLASVLGASGQAQGHAP